MLKNIKRAISILLVLMLSLQLASCKKTASESSGEENKTPISSEWEFYADTLMKSTIVKNDVSEIKEYLPLGNTTVGVTLDVKEEVSQKYVKIMARIKTEKTAEIAEGKSGYLLGAKVNGGSWRYIDISAYINGDSHWIDLPVERGEIKQGENQVEISTTLSKGVSVCISGSEIRNGYTLSGEEKNNITNGQPSIRIKYDAPPDDDSKWQKIAVPGAFENNLSLSYKDIVKANDFNGVGWYRHNLVIPKQEDNKDVWVCFDAVDYLAEVWINGYFVGSHEGGYTPFKFNLSKLDTKIDYGTENEIIVRVTDQSLTQGVGNDYIAIKETLAGFLQDTRGLNYGGIWQQVYLKQRGTIYIEDIFMNTDVAGKKSTAVVKLGNSGDTALETEVKVAIAETEYLGNGKISVPAKSTIEVEIEILMPEFTVWSTENPKIYKADVTVTADKSEDKETVKFGMRTLDTEGAKVVFNGDNIFLTGMLHWGMYWDILTPASSEEQVRKEITELKKAGFNAVKFCLYMPPPYVLDIYDEMGMYTYIEYPMWNPVESDEFFERSYLQMMEMVKRDRNHPSLIMSDFNCEMHEYSLKMDILMKWCVEEAQRIAPNRLYMDNSSCGVQKYGDFSATHPYNQLNKYEDVVKAWVDFRTKDSDKPVVFGEYADIEVLRDLTKLQAEMNPDSVWYHDYFGAVDSAKLMREYGFTEEQIEYAIAASIFNAEEVKRAYVEASKTNPKMAGLFVTHITDLENGTAFGFFDDAGNTRFNAENMKQSTTESALLLGRQTQNVWAGGKGAFTARLSHYGGKDISSGTLSYRLLNGETEVSIGKIKDNLKIKNGDYYELAKFEVAIPKRDETVRYSLELTISDGGQEIARNSWYVWGYPADSLKGLESKKVRLYDPTNKLGLKEKYPWMTEWLHGTADKPDLLITTTMPSSVLTYLNMGGNVLYIGAGDGPIAVKEEWAYNRNVFSFMPDKEHAISKALANDGAAAMQFLELATRYHLDYSAYSGHVGVPIIGRFNYTASSIGAFVAEFKVGKGTLVQSTLRHNDEELRLGDNFIDYYSIHVDSYENVLGEYLLDKLIWYQLS